ncbi:hypothetical protein KIPB_013497, partial [Kipferlia bialata]|eukprot:g13497.t1
MATRLPLKPRRSPLGAVDARPVSVADLDGTPTVPDYESLITKCSENDIDPSLSEIPKTDVSLAVSSDTGRDVLHAVPSYVKRDIRLGSSSSAAVPAHVAEAVRTLSATPYVVEHKHECAPLVTGDAYYSQLVPAPYEAPASVLTDSFEDAEMDPDPLLPGMVCRPEGGREAPVKKGITSRLSRKGKTRDRHTHRQTPIPPSTLP